MTALDMVGCSITLLKTSAVPDSVRRIESDVACIGWPKTAVADMLGTASSPSSQFVDTSALAVQVVPKDENRDAKDTIDAEQYRCAKRAVMHAAKAIRAAEPQLTEWDTLVGDGDCGSTLQTGATAILTMLESRNDEALTKESDLVYAVAHALRHSIGGTSGILYDLFFTAIGTSLKDSCIEGSFARWVEAFSKGVWAIEKTGGATEGCRTMLDALHPARRAAQELLDSHRRRPSKPTAQDLLSLMAKAAVSGADATRTMCASDAAGRTAYVGRDAAEGIPDPGAKAVAIWMSAICESLSSS